MYEGENSSFDFETVTKKKKIEKLVTNLNSRQPV